MILIPSADLADAWDERGISIMSPYLSTAGEPAVFR
jgi:hypothetical protein